MLNLSGDKYIPNYLLLTQDPAISGSQSLSTERTLFLIDGDLSQNKTSGAFKIENTLKGNTALKVNVSGIYVIDVRIHITLDTAPSSSKYTSWRIYTGTTTDSSTWTENYSAGSTIKVRQNSSGSHEWSGTSLLYLNKNEKIAKKQFGNAVPTNVVFEVARNIVSFLHEKKTSS